MLGVPLPVTGAVGVGLRHRRRSTPLDTSAPSMSSLAPMKPQDFQYRPHTQPGFIDLVIAAVPPPRSTTTSTLLPSFNHLRNIRYRLLPPLSSAVWRQHPQECFNITIMGNDGAVFPRLNLRFKTDRSLQNSIQNSPYTPQRIVTTAFNPGERPLNIVISRSKYCEVSASIIGLGLFGLQQAPFDYLRFNLRFSASNRWIRGLLSHLRPRSTPVPSFQGFGWRAEAVALKEGCLGAGLCPQIETIYIPLTIDINEGLCSTDSQCFSSPQSHLEQYIMRSKLWFPSFWLTSDRRVGLDLDQGIQPSFVKASTSSVSLYFDPQHQRYSVTLISKFNRLVNTPLHPNSVLLTLHDVGLRRKAAAVIPAASTSKCEAFFKNQVREIQPAHPRHQATHPACDRPPLVDPAGGSHAARLGALIRLDSVRAFGDSVRRKGRYRPAARNLDAERNGATVWSCKFQKED
ncbi:hypothetical protein C8R43DRAFT_1133148 [Mycena crocata]|nr:hypothetical protein C8R43DRAFT_1133148 [Mycena crocata]